MHVSQSIIDKLLVLIVDYERLVCLSEHEALGVILGRHNKLGRVVKVAEVVLESSHVVLGLRLI